MGEKQVILGIQDITNRGDIRIYPNPVSNQLNVSLTNNGVDFKWIHIYNTNGQLVISNTISSSDMNIDVGSLINGIYFLKLIDETGTVKGERKFLKVN